MFAFIFEYLLWYFSRFIRCRLRSRLDYSINIIP